MRAGSGRIAVGKRVSRIFGGLVMVLVFASSPMAGELVSSSEQAAAVPAANSDQCQEVLTLLVEQDKKNSLEFRQIKRDIAALTQQVAAPGMSEILGGIGYILGLFGVAAYVASRKKADGGGK
jgi:hypothetical protein